MLVRTVPLKESLSLTAEPLTREAFANFGEVIANPHPNRRPSNTDPSSVPSLSFGAVSANQGTAIQYKNLASLHSFYDEAPSGKSASARMTMFVCCGRGELGSDGGIEVPVLERHPFTTQTFIPLTADKGKSYLAIVAPSLSPGESDEGLPVPSRKLKSDVQVPGRGLPSIKALRAFIATGDQAVTYGAGTWHAPMVALGPPDSTIDFVVVQFSNDVPIEDCQEVEINGHCQRRGKGAKIAVRVPSQSSSNDEGHGGRHSRGEEIVSRL